MWSPGVGTKESVNLLELYAERSVYFEESKKMALMSRDTDVENRLADTGGGRRGWGELGGGAARVHCRGLKG